MQPKLASLTLYPARVVPSGPSELLQKVQLVLLAGLRPDEEQKQVELLYREWYVPCSVTGEPILLCDLMYWNVEKNKVYSRPQVIPREDFYPTK